MSVPLPLKQAANFFAETVTVYDITATLVNGRHVNVQEPDRFIKGVIQVRDDSMNIGEGGSISDGVFMLQTTATLYAFDVGENGVVDRKTIVKYSNDVWEVNRIFDWAAKTQGFNLYLLTRYANTLG